MKSYADFIERVDTLLIGEVGADHDDLEDWRWRDAFDDGYSPAEAVTEFLYEVGYFAE